MSKKLIPKYQSGKTIQQALKTTTPREKRKETISSDDRSWLKKTTDNISGFVKNNKTHPAVVYPAIAAGTAILMNPSSLVDLGLGIVAGKAFDERMKEKTGKSWGQYVGEKLDINPEVAGFLNPLYLAGNPIKKEITPHVDKLLKNVKLPSYKYEDIIKSDFYKDLVKNYGNQQAEIIAKQISQQKQFFSGRFPWQAVKAGERHAKQMQLIKDVETVGGKVGGSAKLSQHGTVVRKGLLHDLDFNVPGQGIESPIFQQAGMEPVTHIEPIMKSPQVEGLPSLFTFKRTSLKMKQSDGSFNVPHKRDGVEADMFIKKKAPTEEEAVELVLDAKRDYNRPKDIKDLANYKPYSESNPIINTNTGQGQWNPTLFERIFTKEGYPYVTSIETYPGSGIKVPAVMNYKGQIQMVGNPTSVTRVVGNDGKIYLQLGNHSKGNPRQLRIEPQGNNQFRVHASTWGGITDTQKKQLYEALYNEIPEGGIILFPESRPDYLATRGTIAGLRRLERDSRYTPSGTIQKLLYRDDKDGIVKTFEGTGFKKQQKASNSK